LRVGPLPHLPLTFLYYAPFAGLPPAWGFGLWSLLNLGLALHVVWGLARRFTAVRTWVVASFALGFLPLVYAIFMGQPVVLLLFAFARAYRNWESERDFSAGLWAGLLVLKVQYLPFLVLVLIYKRRFASLAGIALTAAVIVLASLAVWAPTGCAAYLATLKSVSTFHPAQPLICPEQMINWRALVVTLSPRGLTESQGKVITLLLTVVTASALVPIWRGQWEPTGPRFPIQMLAVLLVTMLGTFHNHVHGAALLLVPGMALLARGGGPPPLPLLLKLGWLVPTLDFLLFHHAERSAMLLLGIMATTLMAIVLSTRSETIPGAVSAWPKTVAEPTV
jgi:hypothetical protein